MMRYDPRTVEDEVQVRAADKDGNLRAKLGGNIMIRNTYQTTEVAFVGTDDGTTQLS